jgi:chorismate mutase/prephenate dehydratase
MCKQANRGPLKNAHLAVIWREIMSACLHWRRHSAWPTRAQRALSPRTAALHGTLAPVLDAFRAPILMKCFAPPRRVAAEFGVVPIENSAPKVWFPGSLDLLLNSPLHIVGEISLLVRHNLLRSTPSLDGIEVVYAHPQALCPMPAMAQYPSAWCRTPCRLASNAEGARLAATNPAMGWHRECERAASRIWSYTLSPMPFKTTRSTAHGLLWCACQANHAVTTATGQDVHQPGGLGAQPARRGA